MSYLSNPYNQPPISMLYSTTIVTNSDLDYFISSFESKYDRFREVYLDTKETLMGLSYRYTHYSPLDFERKMKGEVDRILARWEQWFVKTLELTKGVKALKKEFLVKKQYEVSGLSILEARRLEINRYYCNLIYQYEINEKDRDDIVRAIEEVKSKTFGSVPAIHSLYKAQERGEVNPLMKIGNSMLDPLPHLNSIFLIIQSSLFLLERRWQLRNSWKRATT